MSPIQPIKYLKTSAARNNEKNYLFWALAHESHAISMAVDEVLFGIRGWMISQFVSTHLPVAAGKVSQIEIE